MKLKKKSFRNTFCELVVKQNGKALDEYDDIKCKMKPGPKEMDDEMLNDTFWEDKQHLIQNNLYYFCIVGRSLVLKNYFKNRSRMHSECASILLAQGKHYSQDIIRKKMKILS